MAAQDVVHSVVQFGVAILVCEHPSTHGLRHSSSLVKLFRMMYHSTPLPIGNSKVHPPRGSRRWAPRIFIPPKCAFLLSMTIPKVLFFNTKSIKIYRDLTRLILHPVYNCDKGRLDITYTTSDFRVCTGVGGAIHF